MAVLIAVFVVAAVNSFLFFGYYLPKTLYPSLLSPDGYQSLQTCPDPGLASRISRAATGSTLKLPDDCAFREDVRVRKPLTIKGGHIRGSDVWDGFSSAPNGNYVSSKEVPMLGVNPSDAVCEDGTSECLRPEQVFADGQPLEQLVKGTDPGAGQFALDSERHVVLGFDPARSTVEVTVRKQWLEVDSAGVTIDGLEARHAGNGAGYHGALLTDGVSNVTIKNSELAYAHGSVLSMNGGSDMLAENNDIHHGGQQGYHSLKGTLDLIDNKIHDNNVARYGTGWEAGAGKGTYQKGDIWRGNEVYDNYGNGLWCDLNCNDVTIVDNRIHHNTQSAIFYEVSTNGTMSSNKVWENGWDSRKDAWQASIRITNCDGCEIADNVVAWNSSGISVLATQRHEQPTTAHNYVHNNSIILEPVSGSHSFNSCSRSLALAYCEAYDSGMFAASANNRGANNIYYYTVPESGVYPRFSWSNKGYSRLSAFEATPGEKSGRYLSWNEKNALLSSYSISTTP